MSDQSALHLLQNALQTVRDQCQGEKYKDLMSAVDAADSAVEKALGEPDDTTEDKKSENTATPPKTLDGAAGVARREFAQARKRA